MRSVEVKSAVKVSVIPPPQPVWRGRKSAPSKAPFHGRKVSFGRELMLLIVSLPLAHSALSTLGLHRWVLEHEGDIPSSRAAAARRREAPRGTHGAGGVDTFLPADLGDVDLRALVECCESELGAALAADGRGWRSAALRRRA